MQLTRFTDYALRVLMFLADRQGMRTTIKEVSDAHRISEDHLMKVVHRLSKLGYLTAVRGKGGGIKSARLPSEIFIGQVIRSIEPLTPVECFVPGYDGACILYPNCALRGALLSAQSNYLKALDAYTIADVIKHPPRRNSGTPGAASRASPRAAKTRARRMQPH